MSSNFFIPSYLNNEPAPSGAAFKMLKTRKYIPTRNVSPLKTYTKKSSKKPVSLKKRKKSGKGPKRSSITSKKETNIFNDKNFIEQLRKELNDKDNRIKNSLEQISESELNESINESKKFLNEWSHFLKQDEWAEKIVNIVPTSKKYRVKKSKGKTKRKTKRKIK